MKMKLTFVKESRFNKNLKILKVLLCFGNLILIIQNSLAQESHLKINPKNGVSISFLETFSGYDVTISNRNNTSRTIIFYGVGTRKNKIILVPANGSITLEPVPSPSEDVFLGNYKNPHHDDFFVYRLPVPLNGKTFVSQGYNGSYSHKERYAIDFDLNYEPIPAAREGVVLEVEESYKDNKGKCETEDCKHKYNFIKIEHEDGTIGFYAHLAKDGVFVNPGEKIERGQIIGKSGNSGYTQGPHLHFEVRIGSIGLNGAKIEKTIPTIFQIAPGVLGKPQKGLYYPTQPFLPQIIKGKSPIFDSKSPNDIRRKELVQRFNSIQIPEGKDDLKKETEEIFDIFDNLKDTNSKQPKSSNSFPGKSDPYQDHKNGFQGDLQQQMQKNHRRMNDFNRQMREQQEQHRRMNDFNRQMREQQEQHRRMNDFNRQMREQQEQHRRMNDFNRQMREQQEQHRRMNDFNRQMREQQEQHRRMNDFNRQMHGQQEQLRRVNDYNRQLRELQEQQRRIDDLNKKMREQQEQSRRAEDRNRQIREQQEQSKRAEDQNKQMRDQQRRERLQQRRQERLQREQIERLQRQKYWPLAPPAKLPPKSKPPV